MDVASGWFGGRPRLASAQLREAHRLGFDGVSLVPGDLGVDWDGFESTRRELGRGFGAAAWEALLAPGQRPAGAGLATTDPGRQDAALRSIRSVLDAAHALGTSLLVVPGGWDDAPRSQEDGEASLGRLAAGERLARSAALQVRERLPQAARERQLEALARFLHEVAARSAGRALAITASASPAAVLDPAGLALLLAEPALRGLGYWHDAGAVQLRAELGLEDPGAWLEIGGPRALGVTLQDCAGGRDRLLPGEGEVDFALLAEFLPRGARRVLAVAPGYPGATLKEARLALASFGFG